MARAGLPAVLPAAGHEVRARHAFRGMRTVEHYFTVPLDHSAPRDGSGETITVFAREYVSANHSEEAAARLPWLLFLQGGPGGRG
ncbi:MAG: alpha/beta hydrolase, partial [Pseudarthrobacter sp.]|nr:alpha/beta hydrolase [Pseudarthrobacter sp.]